MKQKTINFICFIVIVIACLILGKTVINQSSMIDDLKLANKAVNVANESLTVINDYLQISFDNLVGKREGYDIFGYFTEIPEGQRIHVLINYPKDYPLNEWRKMLLEKHHRYGLREIEIEDWNNPDPL